MNHFYEKHHVIIRKMIMTLGDKKLINTKSTKYHACLVFDAFMEMIFGNIKTDNSSIFLLN